MGTLMPILSAVSATAGWAIKPPAALAAMPLSTVLRNMTFPPFCFPPPLWGGVGVGVERRLASLDASASPPDPPSRPPPQGGREQHFTPVQDAEFAAARPVPCRGSAAAAGAPRRLP